MVSNIPNTDHSSSTPSESAVCCLLSAVHKSLKKHTHVSSSRRFPGVADIVLASSTAWLQCPFSALALVPENGSALSFAQHIGIHRANDFLMFGRKLSAQELLAAGLYNYVWDKTGDEFQAEVVKFLQGQLEVNDGKSMLEMKRLQNSGIRDQRMVSVVNAVDALAERFIDDAPTKRFAEKRAEMEKKSQGKSKL